MSRPTSPADMPWHASDALRLLLPGFEFARFPAADCVHPNPREPEVLDAQTLYWCVVVDVRWPGAFSLRHLRPYVALSLDSPQRQLYGWAEPDETGTYVDHWEHDIHGDDARVVAWQKVYGPVDWVRKAA